MRNVMVALAVAFLAGGVLATAACSGPSTVKDARSKVDVFHGQLDAGDYEAIWKDTSQDIQVATPRRDFVGLLERVRGQLGKVRETKQTGWRVNTDTSGSFASVTMRTVFERGTAQEDFDYRQTEQGLKLSGYAIKPGDRP